jgi:hypothetical protein
MVSWAKLSEDQGLTHKEMMVVFEKGIREIPHLFRVCDTELDQSESFQSRGCLGLTRMDYTMRPSLNQSSSFSRTTGQSQDMQSVTLILHICYHNTTRIRSMERRIEMQSAALRTRGGLYLTGEQSGRARGSAVEGLI